MILTCGGLVETIPCPYCGHQYAPPGCTICGAPIEEDEMGDALSIHGALHALDELLEEVPHLIGERFPEWGPGTESRRWLMAPYSLGPEMRNLWCRYLDRTP